MHHPGTPHVGAKASPRTYSWGKPHVAHSGGLELVALSQAGETQCPVQTAEVDGQTEQAAEDTWAAARRGHVWIK